jgi:transcriptional regulator with PAS, ATPase and Fis domain
VIRLDLPPLRERKEDIPMLVKHFIGRFNRLRGWSVAGICHEALSRLMFHNYPGNIRELENIIEHAFVLCHEKEIAIHCLPENLRITYPRLAAPGTIDESVKSTEALVILDALERNENNHLAATREFGIHKSTLLKKIKRLGIDLPDKKGPTAIPHLKLLLHYTLPPFLFILINMLHHHCVTIGTHFAY